MSNMSYCRFRNTEKDLVDCKEALNSMVIGVESLSEDELEAAKNLVTLCVETVSLVCEAAGIQFEEGVDDDRLLHTALTVFNRSASRRIQEQEERS